MRPSYNRFGTKESKKASSYQRAVGSVTASLRSWLLPESFTKVIGNVTRLQLLVLAMIMGYLFIFRELPKPKIASIVPPYQEQCPPPTCSQAVTFPHAASANTNTRLIGTVYKTWLTPVKNTTLHNTRTGLGGFADRVGSLTYALTPLTILLRTRSSLLTLLTGIPYPSFTFLHRWLGRIIFIQSVLHTLSWTIIEGKLYQPQPSTYIGLIRERYIIWGIVAMTLLSILVVLSTRKAVAWIGYEAFGKMHYVVAAIYMGARWAHWSHLKCWMIASLGIWEMDRGLRFLRTLLIHVGYLDNSKGRSHIQQSTDSKQDLDSIQPTALSNTSPTKTEESSA